MKSKSLKENLPKQLLEIEGIADLYELRECSVYGITSRRPVNGSMTFLLELFPCSSTGKLIMRQTTTDGLIPVTYTCILKESGQWTPFVMELKGDKGDRGIQGPPGDVQMDREYDALNYSGLGYKILPKNLVEGINILTQDMIASANTIYVIRFDYVIDDIITIPANCILDFEGGSFDMTSGTVGFVFNRTTIKSGITQIFKVGDMINKGVMSGVNMCNGEFNSSLTGTLLNSEIYPEWFGAKADSVTDDSGALQYALNTSFNTRASIIIGNSDYICLYTLYQPTHYQMIGHQNDFSSTLVTSKIYFKCRYWFRPKMIGVQTEQQRLKNVIRAKIKGVCFLSNCWSNPYRPAMQATGGDNVAQINEALYEGDPYYMRKTYCYYGGNFTGSIFDGLRVYYVGTFIYGHLNGVTIIQNCKINFYRAFISLAQYGAITAGSTAVIATELGNTTSITNARGTFLGYAEEIEGFTSFNSNIVDVYIHHNYINAGYTRAIVFLNCGFSTTDIHHNYIDFAYCIFYNPPTMASTGFTENKVDHILYPFIGYMRNLMFNENKFLRCTFRNLCIDNLFTWPWNDDFGTGSYSSSALVTKTGVGYDQYPVYNAGTQYKKGDKVYSTTTAYNYINDTPSTGSPVTDAAYWASFVVPIGAFFRPNSAIGIQYVSIQNNIIEEGDIFLRFTSAHVVKSFYFIIRNNTLNLLKYGIEAQNYGFKKYTASPLADDLKYIHIQFWERFEVTSIASAPSPYTLVLDTETGIPGVCINNDTEVVDTTLNKIYRSVNNKWVEDDGEAAAILRTGTTANRPVPLNVGFRYFDTTLGKPIFFKSTGVWVDATGATV